MKKYILLIVVMATFTAAFGQATANQPSPLNVCDEMGEPNDGFASFNLQDKDLEILGGQNPNDYTVTYHFTQNNANSGVSPLTSPYVNIINPQTVYVRVENDTNGDFDTTAMTLRVLPNPEPESPDSIALCDSQNTGFEQFDLTVRETQILNGQNWMLGYFENIADALSQTNNIVTPTNYINISNPQTIYVRVTNDMIPEGCFEIVELDLQVLGLPIIGQPNNLYVFDGDGDGFANFDLTVNEELIAGGLIESMVFYFESQMDAEAFFDPIVTPTSYANLSNPQVIYVGLQNLETGCYTANQSFTIATDGPAPLTDVDEDGLPDVIEDLNNNGDLTDDDTDGDLIPNFQDADDDEDGTLTADEDYNNNGSPTDDDTNNNGIPDYLDESVTLGVENYIVETVAIYPNPTQNKITLQWEAAVQVERIAVYALDGKLITTQVVSQDSTSRVINLSETANGMYFIKISTQKGTLTEKIIKN
ncbi:MAG: hypothetical protein CMC70_12630 [Flavobacteriaceae bacterium]|nr:hypothetical protein [Flavobacteriaceae bacterium]